MSQTERNEPAAEPSAPVPETAPAKQQWTWSQYLAAALTMLLFFNLAALSCLWFSGGSNASAALAEISLGDFAFAARQTDAPRAKFSVHIALLPGAERQGKYLLELHRFKVQQNIEELLRRAHPADFDDPALAELKRQMQEIINNTLGRKLVDQVIITDLSLEGLAARQTPGAAAASPPAAPLRGGAPRHDPPTWYGDEDPS